MTMGSTAAAWAAHLWLPLSVLSASPVSPSIEASAAPSAAAVAVCDLVPIGGVASVLGGTPSGPFPMPERFDEESGARMSGCVFERGDMGVAVTIADFDSRAAAEAAMDILAAGDDDPDFIRLSPRSGPGERSLWGSSEDGAIWVALQGMRILTVTLFGEIRDPAAHGDSMRALATAVLTRM
jgi:hypothetical protein